MDASSEIANIIDGNRQLRSQESSDSNSVDSKIISSAVPTFEGNFPSLSPEVPMLLQRPPYFTNATLFQSPSRSMHASNVERLTLLKVMSDHLPSLETRDTDAKTVHRRASVWNEITLKFNKTTEVKRTRHQVQTLYKNMKAKAKKYQSRLLEHTLVERDAVSEVLLKMLNDEYQQRTSVMQQAAIMAFKEDSSNFKELPLVARDPSQFLKQELLEASEADSSAVASPRASVASSAGSPRCESESSDSAGNEPPADAEPSDQASCIQGNEVKTEACAGAICDDERDNSFQAENLFDIKEVNSSPHPEPDQQQKDQCSQYLSQTENVLNDGHEMDQNSNLVKSTNPVENLSKKRKLEEVESEGSHNHLLTHDRDGALAVDLTSLDTEIGSTSPKLRASCSFMLNEILKMRRIEHELKVKVLKEELDYIIEKRKEEKEIRATEHKFRLEDLSRQRKEGYIDNNPE